jgi:leucyl/phenylalanyl-tRNA--protein transferase
MPLFALDHTVNFPPVDQSEPDGLLAIGGDLTVARLLNAYRKGIFPWYEGNTPLWWCPDPRFVLYPEELKVSKSMRALLKRDTFDFTINRDFPSVIRACKDSPRRGQDGTWINDEVIRAYMKLHELGYAHSAEVWQDGVLAGGLYGIRLGRVFFGESMFSGVSNASKYTFIRYATQLREEGVALIDCQVYTSYLESLGAKMIPRSRFTATLNELISQTSF